MKVLVRDSSPIYILFYNVLFRSVVHALTHHLFVVLFTEILGLKVSFIVSHLLLNTRKDVGLDLFGHHAKLVIKCLIFKDC